MRSIRFLMFWLFLGGCVSAAETNAQVANVASPIPKLDADGPTSFVTALAFNPDGQTLYAAGWDKIIRVWRRDANGRFQLDPAATFRVPIGPGPAGNLNAIAVSADGRWLAAGGNAAFRHGSSFDQPGLVVPAIGAMDLAMREDQGGIFVFDIRTREVRQLRGHQGAVVTLEFAQGQASLLASAGQEWDEQAKVRRGAVRLWNVAEGNLLATSKPLPEPSSRPGLALLNPASRGIQLPTVAIAWGNERFWLWNPNTDQLQSATDSRYNNTVAQVPGLGIVTGSARGLKIWQIAATPTVRTHFDQTLGRAITRAMAIAPSNRGGAFDSLAVVAREPGTEQDRLYMVNPRSGQLLAQPVNLWNGRGTQPALAASAEGDVAVAGGRDYRIVIHRVADLRQNRAAPRQVLDSSGVAVRVAAIARQGERYGLVLSAIPKEQAGQVRTRLLERDRLFDVSAGEFSVDHRGWKIDAPDTAGWTVRREAPPPGAAQRSVLSVLRGGRVAGRIELTERQQLNDYALLPPREPHNRPLLAVAYFDFESGQPVLAMFDVASGDRFREFLGHTGRITSVAASEDGRLLVTAAEDQTVCVWTLADLDQVLGVRGQLTGLKVDSRAASNEQKHLVVAATNRSLEAAGLARGDVLEGIVTGDRVQTLDTARAFYEAISLVKPGATATLRRRRGENDRRDVKVVVGQGIDERKPLLTFFTSRSDGRPGTQWIGWSPLGPYESNDPAIEKLLGWHFNTGRADAPVSFASVDQYRARFSTKGLLKKLFETGRPQLPAEREPEPPAMSLWLEQSGQPALALEPGTSLVLRQGPGALEASTRPFPADQVQSIHWTIGEQSGEFQSADGQWRADLREVSWKRGSYPMQVWLKTMPPDRELKQVLTLVYQPSPPEVKSELPRRIETSNEHLEFQAEVVPAVAGEPFRAMLTHQHGTKEPTTIGKVGPVESWSVSERVRLQPGVNLLKLVAENDSAMSDRADNERSTDVFEVYYDPPQAMPGPRIDLTEVVIRAADGTEEAQRLKSEDTMIVSASRVILRGTMRGVEELTVARFQVGSKAAPAALNGFVANQAKEFAFEQALELQPGVNRVSLQAQAAGSETTERALNLDYRPQLPTPIIRTLPARVFEKELRLVIDLVPPADRQPYGVDVYVNDEQLPKEKVLLAENVIEALATLRAGDNRLEVRLSNEWGSEPVVQTLGVEYVRPPEILELTSERKQEPDAVVMRLRVQSERRPSAALVQVNGEPRRVDFDPKQIDATDQWELNLKPLLLGPGENRISVSVKDDHAESAARELVIAVEKRIEPIPEIVVLSDHNHPVLPDSAVPVEVVVRSASPIQEIAVDSSGEVLHSVSDLGRQEKNEQELYEYVLKTVLRSGHDTKLWRIEAVNRGGRKTVDIPNAVIVPPASLILQSVALQGQTDRRFPLTKSKTGELVLDTEMPRSELVLSGYVLSSPGTASKTQQIPVQVWVNGFLQKPTLAERLEPGSARRPFHAEIVLSQRRGNLIEVGIVDPNLPGDSANRTALVLDCAKPNTARKLHLLVVAVGAKREEGPELRKRAVAAVHGQIKTPREFVTPAFEQGVIHEVLLGSTVQRNKVLFEIGRLARNLRPNDVAMIYYQGDIREADDTFYLTTSATRSLARSKQTEIGRDELDRWFGSMAGAQLILLDVDRAATPQQSSLAKQTVKARWPADSHIAVFRFAWALPEPATTPDEPVLLTAWEQAARKDRTLAQIDSSLASFSTATAGRYPAGLVYERHLPAPLGNLDFGPAAEQP